MSTYRELLDRVAACTTPEQASELVTEETGRIRQSLPSLLPEQARDIVMHNIGYLTGYLDRGEAGRLLAMFGARHPVLGAIEDWPQAAEETIRLGMQLAQQQQEGVR